MKANSLSLDPDLTAALGECEVGETKSMMVTVRVDAKDDTGLKATVTEVEPYEMEEVEEEETPPSGSSALKEAIE